MSHQSTNGSSASTLIEQGLALAERDERQQAQQAFAQALQLDPRAERAWLGLAMVVPTPERRAYCLNRCLTINPDNEAARRELAALTGPAQPSDPAGEPEAAPTEAAQPSEPAPAEESAPEVAPAAEPTVQVDEQPEALARPVSPRSSDTPLAARLAAAAAKRDAESAAPALQPQPSTSLLASLDRERRESKPRQSQRARYASEPPPVLRPVELSQAPAEAPVRVSDEEIAQAALRQLLGHDDGDDTNGRTSSAASIARRYFSTSRPAAAKGADASRDAARALGLQRTPARGPRVAGLVSVLLMLSLMGVLLFSTLLRVG